MAAPERVATVNQPGDISETLTENEPNDQISTAQLLSPGQILLGQTGYNQTDWFKVPVPATAAIGEVRIRRNAGRGLVEVSAFDQREQMIGSARVADNTEYLPLEKAPGAFFYLRVQGDYGLPADYEILVQLVGGN